MIVCGMSQKRVQNVHAQVHSTS